MYHAGGEDMIFNSLSFLFLFLPVTYFVFWRPAKRSDRFLWLTLSSYVFYGFWNWKFCFLMAFSTLVAFVAGLGLRRLPDGPKRKAFMVVPIVIDLTILSFFKYANFALDSCAGLLRFTGVPVSSPHLDIILPVGISFYTFHTITYVIDGYRRVITPTRSFLEFSCYVSLFAQLVAGPIVRFGQIEGDLHNLEAAERTGWLDRGWSLFCIGMAKKVLLADTLSGVITPSLDSHVPLTTASAWICMLGYAYQIYFDFSGYSDMAMGLGLLFGLRLPWNFDSPYKATDPSDFWRRWHISLSSVLRDYLYIPLGGNRGGRFATVRNLFFTFLLGGLWHGAQWTFVLWGAYHGALLVIHRLVRESYDRMNRLLRQAITFLLVVIGWTFFRASDIGRAGSLLNSMFTLHRGVTPEGPWSLGVLLVAAAIAHLLPNTSQLHHDWRSLETTALTAALVASLLVIYAGKQSPFLYFQF